MNHASSIRALVFDFDGTLVDSNDVKRNAYDAAFAPYPGAASHIRAALSRYRDRDRRYIIEAVAKRMERSGQITRAETPSVCLGAIRRYSHFCRIQVAAAPDFHGVEAALAALSRRYSIAINSGTPQRQLRYLIQKRRWGHRCSLVYGAPASKVANLQRIARDLNLQPNQIALVGDSEVDAEAAERFGCVFIHAAVGQALARRGAFSISTMAELVDVARRLSRGQNTHV